MRRRTAVIRRSLPHHRDLDGAAVAPARNHHEPVRIGHPEIEADAAIVLEKARHVGIVEWFDTDDVGTGRESRHGKAAIAIEREASDEQPVGRIEGRNVRAKHPQTVQGDTTRERAGRIGELAVGIEVRDAGDIVGAQQEASGALGDLLDEAMRVRCAAMSSALGVTLWV